MHNTFVMPLHFLSDTVADSQSTQAMETLVSSVLENLPDMSGGKIMLCSEISLFDSKFIVNYVSKCNNYKPMILTLVYKCRSYKTTKTHNCIFTKEAV